MAGQDCSDPKNNQLPSGYTDLASVVRNGSKPAVNVIGVVVDCMTPSHTKGTDMQMTIRIRDLSPLPNGMRVKFFYRSVNMFPDIYAPGDIILIRSLKINIFAQEVQGISSFKTTFIVFPKPQIISAGKSLKQKSSEGATTADAHEQQWVMTLDKTINGPSSDQSTPLSSSKQTNSSSASSSSSAQTAISRIVQPMSTKDKFSLIKDVEANKFYDIAGEVIKLYFEQAGFGILDLYITDYTANSKLLERKANEPSDSSQGAWKGPPGRVSLHIEVHPPHSVWAQQNVVQGEFVLVKNVRIKYNQRGLGSELEGNIWQDQNYPDRVNISSLHPDHHRYAELDGRKTAFLEASTPKASTESNRARNKKRKQREKAKREAKRQKFADEEEKDSSQVKTDCKVESSGTPTAINPNVVCDHVDKPLSAIDLIINNPARWYPLPNGEKQEFPYVDVNHHTQLRVIDFYPHELQKFAVLDADPNDASIDIWQWRFWLDLAEIAPSDSYESSSIRVGVRGEEARYLLQMAPGDLGRDSQKLKQLEETLFLLWGELAETKAKFMRSHPQIASDPSFNTAKYNLIVENRLFDLCVVEHGVKRQPLKDARGSDNKDPWQRWERGYKIFGTKIQR